MQSIDGESGRDTKISCPLCIEDGNLTESGFVPHLLYFPDLDPPWHCPAAHGAVPPEELARHGVDPGGC